MADISDTPPNGWQGARLRGAPPALTAAWISVVAVAVLACVGALLTEKSTATTWIRLGELALLCAVFEEIAAQVGKMRLLISTGPQPDMTSVWTFAAALVVPPGYAGLLVALVATNIWLRRQRAAGQFLFRKVYTAATIMLACLGASAVLDRFGSSGAMPNGLRAALAVLLALAVYTLTNRVLVVLAARLSGARPGPSIVGTWTENALELATLCLGGLMAVVMLEQPWLGLLVLLPMVLLQRGALVKELEQAAVTDSKTGLLNADAWRRAAVRELSRAERERTSTGVLIIDLDHFKAINDEHGHLVGDLALLAVGRRLTQELRQYDVVGRFGGEEFVVLLPRIELADTLATAERIRSSIEAISVEALRGAEHGPTESTLSASVGLALYPWHGRTTDELLVAADVALYRAKRAGRNRVIVADQATNEHDRTPIQPTT